MLTTLDVKRAIRAANDILSWAIKTFPELHARGLPRVLATYATASAIFRESGYTWFERNGDEAFVLRTYYTEKYEPIIPFTPSNAWLVSKGISVTYWAVNERFVNLLAHARYYLPTVSEIEELLTYMRPQKLTALLIVPYGGPVAGIVRKILGGEPDEASFTH